jgi:hypothetical protein
VASGLVNTSRQIGGALGLATIAAIATTTAHSATAHGVAATGGEALDHGFRVALVVQLGVLLARRVAAAFIRPPAPRACWVVEESRSQGGRMTSETKALLNKEIDNLLLDARGSRSSVTCSSSGGDGRRDRPRTRARLRALAGGSRS